MTKDLLDRAADLPRAADGRDAIAVARDALRQAARTARRGFARPRLGIEKGRGNLVTATDLAVEKQLQALLSAAYPAHRLLSEETQANTGLDGWVWVLDPIDGTKNFSMGIPVFCLNLALCRDGVPQLGLTYDPMRHEEFLAVRGHGLTVNGRPAHASSRRTLAEAVLGIDAGYNYERGGRVFQMLAGVWPGILAVRTFGSAALGIAYAAAGRFDLFVHQSLYPWDIAAGLVLVEEGGGRVTDRDGGPATLASESIVAGGADVHADFLHQTAAYPWRK